MLLKLRNLLLTFKPAARLVLRCVQAMPLKGRILSGPGIGLRFDATGRRAGYLLGTTAPEEQRLLMQSLKRGDVFWDVGANIGFYAILAARQVGMAGEVVAFEPVGESAARVEWNAHANGMDQVAVIRAACGAERGILRGIVTGVSGTNGEQAGDGEAACDMPMITLDEFATGRRLPNVVMIDVEGHEIEVLRGAMRVLQTAHPTLLIEVHGGGDAFRTFVDEQLVPLGYVATTYAGAQIPRSATYRYHAILRTQPTPRPGLHAVE